MSCLCCLLLEVSACCIETNSKGHISFWFPPILAVSFVATSVAVLCFTLCPVVPRSRRSCCSPFASQLADVLQQLRGRHLYGSPAPCPCLCVSLSLCYCGFYGFCGFCCCLCCFCWKFPVCRLEVRFLKCFGRVWVYKHVKTANVFVYFLRFQGIFLPQFRFDNKSPAVKTVKQRCFFEGQSSK